MSEKLTREQLEGVLDDLKDEPVWRDRANREADYYDGSQLDSDTLAIMAERNQPPLIRNLIGPVIDLVLGMQAKNPRDFKVGAEAELDFDMSLALSALIKQHERSSGADKACSDAYADLVKTGLGWVEVARNTDPLKAQYRVRCVDWREMFWDWRSREPDLSDARYIVRHRWTDLDVAKLYFPKKQKVLEEIGRGWANWELGHSADMEGVGEDMLSDYTGVRDTSLALKEWMDYGQSRHRTRLSEVWYRHYKRASVMRLPDGSAILFDDTNPRHRAVKKSGMVSLDEQVVAVVRLAWWCGPVQLADIPSPYGHNQFPYVPFFGFREGRTKAPYGLIRRMVSPQDEVNSRLSRMMWLLSAKRIIADSDSSERPWHEVLENVSRPDAVVLLDPSRKNKNMDAFRVESDFQLSQQQFQVLRDATEAIQASAGVYQTMLGQATPGADSGIAINSLVEQGATTLAELNDNYAYSRTQVGEQLLALITEDMGNAETPVYYDFAGQRKSFVFNARDEAGEITNRIPAMMLKVALQDVPDTPTYRAQQFQNLTEVLKSLPPELQAAVAHIVIRASDLPQKEEMAQLIAQVTGQGGQTPEQEAAAQQQQQMEELQNQLLMQQQQVALMEQEAKVEKLKAEAERLRHGMILDEGKLGLEHDRYSLDVTDRVIDMEKGAADREAQMATKAMDQQHDMTKQSRDIANQQATKFMDQQHQAKMVKMQPKPKPAPSAKRGK